MPTSSPPADENFAFEVTAYGINDRDTARRLIKSLASIPVIPLLVFPIGPRKNRLFGVVNQFRDERLYYVHVTHWGGRKRGLPGLEWSKDPFYFGRRTRSQGDKALTDATSGVRDGAMKLKCRIREHSDGVQE